jgi:hypothetical protein
MLTGMLAFGAVTWYLRRSPELLRDYPAERLGMLVMTGRVLWTVDLVACIVLLQMTRRARDPARATSLSIIAWALGEGLAIFGGVFWYLTGNSNWYGAGLAFLVLTFLVFPASPRAR